MATISGSVIFDRNRSNTFDTGDSGIANVPVVLQDISTGNGLTVLTDVNGNYEFINVPNGSYRIVEAFGEAGGVPTPGDFSTATVINIPVEQNPPISFAINPPAGATNLDDVRPSTLLVTVSGADLTDQDFFDGPVKYTPISVLLDPCAVVTPTNLITAADNGTFGAFPQGTPANTGAPDNPPYPGVTPDFVYVLPNPLIEAPDDGEYTIQNIINNNINNVPPRETWWRIADHTTGTETGRFMLVNGFNPGAVFFQQTVPVTPNTSLLFSSWIINVARNVLLAPPLLGVEILDQNNNIIFQETLGVDIPTNVNLPEWKEIGIVIDSQNNSQLTVKFLSQGAAAIGNDYAIDDIKLQPITVPVFSPLKSISSPTAVVGEIVTYTVTLTNTYNNLLTDVFFQDTVPNGLSFVHGSVTGGLNPATDNPNVGFFISNIPGDGTATITFEALVNSIPTPNPIENTATMSYLYSPVLGGIPNSFTETSNSVLLEVISFVEEADISVVKTANINSIAAEALETVLIRGTVSPSATGPITNTATVSSPTFDPNLANNSSTSNITVVVATLSVMKTVDKTAAIVGDTLTYTVVIRNTGNTAAENVVFTDPIPAGTSFVPGSVTINGVTNSSANPAAGINLGTIAAGASVIVTFKVMVEFVPTPPEAVNEATVNFSFIGAPNQPAVEESATSNIVTTVLEAVEVIAVKSADKTFALRGDIITFTITVINPSTIPVNNVIVTDQIPAGTSFVPGSLTVNNVPVSGDITTGINIGTLEPNASATVSFEVMVVSVPCPPQISNRATVTFEFTLAGMVVTGSTTSNLVLIAVGPTSFKQFSVDETLTILSGKPDIEQILNTIVEPVITSTRVIPTMMGTSLEGQILTGFKLIVDGMLKQKIEYVADEPTQSVHASEFDVRFSTFIVLPEDFVIGTNVNVTAEVEDVFTRLIDKRTIFKNVTLIAKTTCTTPASS